MSEPSQQPTKADRIIARISAQLGNALANCAVLEDELDEANADRVRLAQEVQRLAAELESCKRDAEPDDAPPAT